MSRKKKYALWLIGTLVFSGTAFALAFMRLLSVRGGFGIAVFWLWNGICLMMDWHPEYRQYDRWERRAYGLAFTVMGAALVAIAFIPMTNIMAGLAFVFVPTGLIALIGRFWYVVRKRSEEWNKQNQTEKD